MHRRGFIKRLGGALGAWLALRGQPEGWREPLPEKLEAPTYGPVPKPAFEPQHVHDWGDCLSGSCTMNDWGHGSYFISGAPITAYVDPKYYPRMMWAERLQRAHACKGCGAVGVGLQCPYCRRPFES